MRDYTVLRQDTWLEPLMPLFGQPAQDNPILELGCGPGDDTHYLRACGHPVTAVDMSQERLDIAAKKAPSASFHKLDLTEPFPFTDASYGGILASLCLHYFTLEKTAEIISEVRRCLEPGGCLIARFNSTNDTNFGAAGFPEIGRNYYLVHGFPKRFFDTDTLNSFFADGWIIEQLEEKTIDRYEKAKVVWQLISRKQ